jgi:ABC-type metal ion transport system substrate-binding protein
MSYLRNEITKRRKSIKEKSQKKEQLKNIISLRINDEEKETLEKLTKSTSKSISDIMREAINLWSSQRSKLCLD